MRGVTAPADRLVGRARSPVTLGIEVVVGPADRELAGEDRRGEQDPTTQGEVGQRGESGTERGDRHRGERVTGQGKRSYQRG